MTASASATRYGVAVWLRVLFVRVSTSTYRVFFVNVGFRVLRKLQRHGPRPALPANDRE
jgi:hypothetical protein